VLLLYYIIII